MEIANPIGKNGGLISVSVNAPGAACMKVIPGAGHVNYAASKGGVMLILRPAVKI